MTIFTRGLGSTGLALVIGCSAAGAGTGLPRETQQVAGPALVRQALPSPQLHLYVSDNLGSTVDRFPIVDGVVASAPDNTLNINKSPGAIATDSMDNLYVAVVTGVEVFAPGAAGNARPVRTLTTGEPFQMAIDSNGFLYLDQGSTVNVFAPGAKGGAAPVATLSLDFSVDALALDSSNNLYLGAALQQYISAYSNVASGHATLVRKLCAEYQVAKLATATLNGKMRVYALEAGSKNGYLRILTWQGAQSRPCPGSANQIKMLGIKRTNRFSSGIAIDSSDAALFFTSSASGPGSATYQFNALDFSPQRPAAAITSLLRPWGVAVAP